MAKVFPINDEYISSIENPSTSGTSINSNKDLGMSLDMEKELHEINADKRQNQFKSLILGGPILFSWKKLILYAFGIMFAGFSATIPFSMIPASDLVLSPQKWYEILFPGLVVTAIGTTNQIFTLGSCLNIQYPRSNRVIASVNLGKAVYALLVLVTTYYVWTQILSYNYPIPYLGFYFTLSFYIIDLIIIWFIIPADWRQNKTFKKRYGFYFFYCIFHVLMANVYGFVVTRIKKSPDQFQPINALMLPVLRELFERIGVKIIRKSTAGDAEGAEIFLKYSIATRHTVTLCTILGTIATTATSLVLIAVDFTLNIYCCLRIVWLRKRHPNRMENPIEYLKGLAVYELVEFHAPLAFFLVFTVAYYGPNGTLFGNILNDYWTFCAVDDITHTMTNLALFFAVDFLSTLICSLLLWFFCEVRLWQSFLILQDEFCKEFCIILGFYLMVKLNNTLISWGNDRTGEFAWIET